MQPRKSLVLCEKNVGSCAKGAMRSRREIMKAALIISDPEILDGTPVFAGTRVLVKNLTDCLEAGDSIAVFLDDFPTVSRDQVIAFLEEARTQVTSAAFAHA